MTQEIKNYTVMELAEAVGVPRTTINDWLSKYSQFVSYSVQGKRRIYSATTLEMLKSVSSLRTQGLSSFDIETELAKLYPLHGETVPPPMETPPLPMEKTPDPVPDAPEQAGTSIQPPSGALTLAQMPPILTEERFALLVKENRELAQKDMDNRFQTMLDTMDKLGAEAGKARHSARMAYIAVTVMIFVFTSGMFLAWFYAQEIRTDADNKFNNIKEESFALYKNDMDTLKDTAEKQSAAFSDSLSGVSDEAKALRDTVTRLETGLPEQRKAFEKLISDTKNSLEQAIRQRDEAAAKREAASRAEYEKNVKAKNDEILSI